MPGQPWPKMQLQRDVNQVRSQRKTSSESSGFTNSTKLRGKPKETSAMFATLCRVAERLLPLVRLTPAPHVPHSHSWGVRIYTSKRPRPMRQLSHGALEQVFEVLSERGIDPQPTGSALGATQRFW